jgi:hypothetical protein
MVIIPKLNPTLEHDIVSGIIDAVGRPITITTVSSRSLCPVCSGNDPFCTTCYGNKTVDVVGTTTLTASVIWKGTDRKLYTPAGQFIEGDCQVMFSVPLENYESYDTMMKQAISITVDGRVCVIDNWVFGGSPINRILATLSVDNSTSGQRIG